MCGTVGLFLGCAAVSFCPKALLLRESTSSADATLADDAGVDETGPEDLAPEAALYVTASLPAGASGDGRPGLDIPYRSPFRRWDASASVRSAPRRVLTDDDDGKLYFSPDFVPLARHPVVSELPPEAFDQLLVQHLYRYLDFTARLEHLVVNRTALGIAHGTIGIDLPDETRLDAYRIYCDEAYHALFSRDLMMQVQRRTGVPPRLPAQPFFLTRLERLLADLPADLRPLAELLFVVVSETLISATLAQIPDDPRVAKAVSEVVRDHAVDEGRHHTYFVMFLRMLWGQLHPRERVRSALLVPELIQAFLLPDEPAMQAELEGYGLSADRAQEVVAQVFPAEMVQTEVRAAARRTVKHFQALGALQDTQVHDRFLSSGLL